MLSPPLGGDQLRGSTRIDAVGIGIVDGSAPGAFAYAARAREDYARRSTRAASGEVLEGVISDATEKALLRYTAAFGWVILARLSEKHRVRSTPLRTKGYRARARKAMGLGSDALFSVKLLRRRLNHADHRSPYTGQHEFLACKRVIEKRPERLFASHKHRPRRFTRHNGDINAGECLSKAALLLGILEFERDGFRNHAASRKLNGTFTFCRLPKKLVKKVANAPSISTMGTVRPVNMPSMTSTSSPT